MPLFIAPGVQMGTSQTGILSIARAAGSGILIGTQNGGYITNGSHCMQINSSGTASPLVASGGSGLIEIWKDATPSKASAFGMAIPGNAIGDDFIFTKWDGSSWSETFRLLNSGGHAVFANRVNFGGSTSSFPSLKRNSTTLEVRLADDSNYGPFRCAGLTSTSVTASGKIETTVSGSSDSAIRCGSLELQPFGVNNCWISDNAFYNGSSFVRRSTGAAGLFYFQGGEGQFRFASSGSASSTFAASIMYKINVSGEMGVGVSPNYNTGDFGGFGFYVAGASGICAVKSDGLFAFSGNSANANGTRDTAISRNAAGVVEINSGTSGTFGDLIVRNLRMSSPTGVPATAGATGTEGSIRWDADYIYICTATNTWKRAAIATW